MDLYLSDAVQVILYNVFVKDTKPFRLTESVKAAG